MLIRDSLRRLLQLQIGALITNFVTGRGHWCRIAVAICCLSTRPPALPTGTAWTVLPAAADTSSEGPKRPTSRVLHGFGAWAKPGAKRQTQAGVAGGPNFDPYFAEEPGFIEPYLCAIPACPQNW